MSNDNCSNEDKAIIFNLPVMLSCLTKDEMVVVELMKKGAEITGKELAEKSIQTYVDWCVKAREASN